MQKREQCRKRNKEIGGNYARGRDDRVYIEGENWKKGSSEKERRNVVCEGELVVGGNKD